MWSSCRNWRDGSSNRLYHRSSVRSVPALAPTSEGGLGAKRLPAEEHPSLYKMWACTLKKGRWRNGYLPTMNLVKNKMAVSRLNRSPSDGTYYEAKRRSSVSAVLQEYNKQIRGLKDEDWKM